MITESGEVSISFAGNDLIGKNAVVKSFTINRPAPEFRDIVSLGSRFIEKIPLAPAPIEIEISLLVSEMEEYAFLFGEKTKKISKKKVEDCTIQELLFAVRKKIKEGK